MKILPPLVSLLAAISPITAVAAEKVKSLDLAVFCPVYAEGLKTVFIQTGKDSYQGVALSTANVVTVGKIQARDGKIMLHGPSAGDGVYPVIAAADVSGMREPLLLVTPGRDAGGTAYDSRVIEGAPAQFPLGSYNLVNLSSNPVRITSGGRVMEIKPGANTLFKANVSAGEAMPVTIDQQSGGTWQLVSSAQWASRNDRRTLVCFLQTAGSQRMVVKSVPLRESASR